MSETWGVWVRNGRRKRLVVVNGVTRTRASGDDGKPADAGDVIWAAFRQKLDVPLEGIMDVERLDVPAAEATAELEATPQATGFMQVWKV